MLDHALIQFLKSTFPAEMSPGLIGVGSFGSEIRRFLLDSGCPDPLLCDPPLSRDCAEEQFDAITTQWGNGMGGCNPVMPDYETYLPKEALAKRCNWISVQVPYSCGGSDATSAVIDESFLSQCSPEAVILCLCNPLVVAEDVKKDPRIHFFPQV